MSGVVVAMEKGFPIPVEQEAGHYGRYGEERSLVFLPEVPPRLFCHPALKIVTVPTNILQVLVEVEGRHTEHVLQ